ncbi:MAG: hypothetical protein RIK87_10230, partial [Fuerstiella sp.]
MSASPVGGTACGGLWPPAADDRHSVLQSAVPHNHQAADEYEHYSVKSFMLRRNHVYWHMKAGHPGQARLFAWFSLLLARVRALAAIFRRRNSEHHRQYVVRFRDAVRGILSRRPLGDWFGPPVGRL